MGTVTSRTMRAWKYKNDRRVLFLGLSGSGKSYIFLIKMLLSVFNYVPIISFIINGKAQQDLPKTETYVIHKYRTQGLKFYIWDVSGSDADRLLWRHYYTGCNGIVFVIDGGDSDSLDLAKRELEICVKDNQLTDSVILILNNKCDLEPHISNEELSKQFNLEEICKNHKYTLMEVCTITGYHINDAVDWMCENLQDIPNT